MSQADGAMSKIIDGLLVAVVIGAIAGTMFSQFGTGSAGLGNATLNPDVPTWLPTTLVVILAVGLLFLVYRVFVKNK